MEVILTPSLHWLERAAEQSRQSINVSSPFVGEALLSLLGRAPSGVAKTLVTRTRLQDFASGASNLKAVSAVAKTGVRVISLDSLHAKVYVFDDTRTLITSANATYSGFNSNIECGIAFEDSTISKSLSAQIRSAFGTSREPALWDEARLNSMLPLVEQLRQRMPKIARERVREGEEEGDIELPSTDADKFISATAGWTRLVFRSLRKVPQEEFTLKQIYAACREDHKREYPKNTKPDAQIRQKLQVLREMGIVKFLNYDGKFRVLIKFTA